VGVGVALFFALLQGLAFMFSLHDKPLPGAIPRVIAGANGQKLQYFERTIEPADWNLIFVHGTPASAAIFWSQFNQPFPRANLYSIDRPGFGGSSASGHWPSLDEQVDALGRVLEQVGSQPVILVGHSYGGPVVLAAALRYTNRIGGALLMGGSVDPAEEKIYWPQYVGDWPGRSWLLPRVLRQCNRELLSLKADLLALQPRLSSLRAPVLMLHGTEDRQVPVANVAYLGARLGALGKSNLFDAMVLPGYSHFIPWEHPEAVESALAKLTNRVEALPARAGMLPKDTVRPLSTQ
jgi:pimeloyl-ACP methyl ester carboxylesterase